MTQVEPTNIAESNMKKTINTETDEMHVINPKVQMHTPEHENKIDNDSKTEIDNDSKTEIDNDSKTEIDTKNDIDAKTEIDTKKDDADVNKETDDKDNQEIKPDTEVMMEADNKMEMLGVVLEKGKYKDEEKNLMDDDKAKGEAPESGNENIIHSKRKPESSNNQRNIKKRSVTMCGGTY